MATNVFFYIEQVYVINTCQIATSSTI